MFGELYYDDKPAGVCNSWQAIGLFASINEPIERSGGEGGGSDEQEEGGGEEQEKQDATEDEYTKDDEEMSEAERDAKDRETDMLGVSENGDGK